MYVQIMTEEQAKHHYENPFDITKIWRHAEYPLIEVGELELNRWPGELFCRGGAGRLYPRPRGARHRLLARQVPAGPPLCLRRCPALPPGREPQPDPVNQAKGVPGGVADYHRDGAMRTDGNYGGAPAYTPNSYGYWTAQPDVAEPPLDLSGAMWRYDPKDDPTDDCFRAGGDLWRVMTEDKREDPHPTTPPRTSPPVTVNIKYRHAVHCLKADPEYGRRMTEALGLDPDKVRDLAKLDFPYDGLIQATLCANISDYYFKRRERFAMKQQRSTKQRQLVLEAVRARRDHPSADQIYHGCPGEGPSDQPRHGLPQSESAGGKRRDSACEGAWGGPL
jgi:catalase